MDEHEVPGEIKGETTGSTIWTILRTMLCFAAWCGAAALTFASPPRSQTNHAEYMGHVLSLKPVGYWPLNEERGTVAHDASPFKRNGTYHGHPAFREQGPILGGFAVAFGAAGKTYVEIASDRDFSQHTHRGLSVEAWMRPDTLTFPGETNEPYVYWLGKGEDGHMEWGFRFYSRETYRPNWTSAYIWNQTRLSGGKNLGAGRTPKTRQPSMRGGMWSRRMIPAPKRIRRRACRSTLMGQCNKAHRREERSTRRTRLNPAPAPPRCVSGRAT